VPRAWSEVWCSPLTLALAPWAIVTVSRAGSNVSAIRVRWRQVDAAPELTQQHLIVTHEVNLYEQYITIQFHKCQVQFLACEQIYFEGRGI
jgi:hypothetical protein